MTANAPDDWVEVNGAFDVASMRALLARGPIEQLSFSQGPRLTRRVALLLRQNTTIRRIWLWVDVTRNALNDVVAIPSLEVLDVLEVTAPGQLSGFKDAALHEFRCAGRLFAADLIEVLRAPALRELQSHYAEINAQVVNAVLDCKTLSSLDLEGSNVDDTMIEQLSRSKQLLSLAVGATRITVAGLKRICRMTQLEHLDIWFTKIEDADLSCLGDLPKLKSLSAGGHHGGPHALHANLILPSLRKLKSLEKIWLDGVYCSAEEEGEIRALFPDVRIDRAGDF